MSGLASCDVAAVEQAAYRLADCAELAADAQDSCVVAMTASPHWRGSAAGSFDGALARLRHRLAVISSAHREGGDALAGYARVLADVVHLARRADALDREADSLSAAFRAQQAAASLPVLGPDPGEACRTAAARCRGEAEEIERAAAARVAAELDQLASRAPSPPLLAGATRFVDDTAAGLTGAVVDFARLAVMTGESFETGRQGHEARAGLWQTAKDSLKVWQPVQDMWRDFWGGRPGSAFSAALGMVLTKKQRLTLIRDPQLAHRLAHREAGHRAWRAEEAANEQTVDGMLRDGVSLVAQEIRGGHAIDRHVAAPRQFMRVRIAHGLPRASTFRDLESATSLVNAVLRDHARELRDIYALPPGSSMTLRSEFHVTTGRVTVAGSSRTLPGRSVVVVIRLQGGEPLVLTAYPDL